MEQQKGGHALPTSFFDELREALLVLEPLADSSASVIDVRCAYANAAFLSMTREEATRFNGRTLREIRTETEFAWLDRCENAVKNETRDAFSIYDVFLNRWLEIRVFAFEESRYMILADDVTRRRDFHIDSSTESSVLRTITKLTKRTEDLLFTLDPSGRFTGVFGTWIDANGFSPDYFVGKSVNEVLGEEAETKFESALMQAVMNGYTEYQWTFHPRFKKEATVLQVIITPIEQGDKNFGMLGIGRDITKLVHKQNELNHALREKTVLLQEVLHRVNNNLQLIVSLIELQLLENAQLPIHVQFGILKSRIRAMATVHETLASSSSNDKIQLKELVLKQAELIDDEKELFASLEVHRITVDEGIILPVETALPVALILHECALTLARRTDGQARPASITLDGELIDERRCGFSIGHDQPGFPETAEDLSETIIQGLTSQIKGTIEDRAEPAGLRRIVFPVNGAGHPLLPADEANG